MTHVHRADAASDCEACVRLWIDQEKKERRRRRRWGWLVSAWRKVTDGTD